MFRGIDGTECEDFIFAIRQRAFSEGKIKDNDWALALASVSFARGALRWFTTLDDSIQNDWVLLQKALLARFRPVFKGIDGIECEEFISDIRQRALDQGKPNDDEVCFGHLWDPFTDLIRLTVDPQYRICLSRRRRSPMARES